MPAQSSATGLVAATEVAPPEWQRLTDGGGLERRRARRRPPSIRRVLVHFVAANLVVVALLLAGSAWAGHLAARASSLGEARTTTDLLASLLIEPELAEVGLSGDRDALDALDAALAGELAHADAVRIKIWNSDSEVVYSDARRLIGESFPLDEEQQEILRNGGMLSEVSSLREAENVFEKPPGGRLLEVYRRIAGPDGEFLLLETYYPYELVNDREMDIWLSFAPISAAVLLAMLLVQVPLAKRMIRQVREGDAERLRLHARAADASNDERRRIAGSLHDGVVQDLSAAPLFMSRAVGRLRTRPDADGQDLEIACGLDQAATAVRGSVASLRSLLIEIYPPNLAQAGLPAALADLTARVRNRGVQTRLELPDYDLDLPSEAEALLFRVAQEAVLNAIKHARASTVVLAVQRGRRSVTMEIRDDGAGFDPSVPSDSTGTGHFGFRVLTDLAEAAGATLDLATAPGRGTALRLWVPVRR